MSNLAVVYHGWGGPKLFLGRSFMICVFQRGHACCISLWKGLQLCLKSGFKAWNSGSEKKLDNRTGLKHFRRKEWPRYCRKVYWTKMIQNGQDDLFGPTERDQFGPFASVNRTMATPKDRSDHFSSFLCDVSFWNQPFWGGFVLQTCHPRQF